MIQFPLFHLRSDTSMRAVALTAFGIFAIASHPLDAQTGRTPARSATTPARNDTVAYIYLRGADTVAIERIVSQATGVRGELVVRGQGRIVWHQHINGINPTAFDLDAYAPTASATAAPAQSVTLRVVGDSGFMDVNSNGASNTLQRLKIVPGAEWMLNSSVLHTEVLASLAAKRKQDTVNLVLAQGGTQLKMFVHKVGDTTSVNVANMDMRFVHDALGLKEASSGPTTTVRRVAATDLAKLSAKAAAEKPSYSAPTGAPYTAEDVIVKTESGFQLAGTVDAPTRAWQKSRLSSPSAEAVNRNAIHVLHRFQDTEFSRDIADTLGRRGIAVLRMDDRGVGASTGRETRAVATSADYANDVKEVLKYARTRKDIDASRIVLLGHSEGWYDCANGCITG